jgi:hypothetical protein
MGKRNWRIALSRRTKELIKRAEDQGWTVDCTSNGHVRFTSPEGHVVIGSSGGRGELDQHHKRTVKRLGERGLA